MKVTGVNRSGLECPIPVDLREALSGMPPMVLDGELVGDTYYVFDLLELDDANVRKMPLEERYRLVEKAANTVWSARVRLVRLITNTLAKAKLVKQLRSARKEGVVFKRLDAPYIPGRIENLGKATAVKVKFYADGLFRIAKWNAKSSIAVEAWDEASGTWAGVGNVTVARKYASQIAPLKMVRVRYLYATPARVLYQPNLDPTTDGIVCGDDVTAASATRLADLKLEGKDE